MYEYISAYNDYISNQKEEQFFMHYQTWPVDNSNPNPNPFTSIKKVCQCFKKIMLVLNAINEGRGELFLKKTETSLILKLLLLKTTYRGAKIFVVLLVYHLTNL